MCLKDVHFLPAGINIEYRFDNALLVVELRAIDEVLEEDAAPDGKGCEGRRRRCRHGHDSRCMMVDELN